MALRLKPVLPVVFVVCVVCVLAAAWGGFRALGAEDPTRAATGAAAPSSSTTEDPPPEVDPLGPNGACYVCHMTFVKEELAKSHLVEKIACVKCHGLSDKHANDENIGATKPDIVFKRSEVDASCLKCHDSHDVPATQVVARFVERGLTSSKSPLICTDCHGHHKIDRAIGQ